MNSFLTALHSMFNDLKGCWRSLLQTMNGYSLALFLVSATSLLTSPLAPAQPSGTAQNSEIITVFGGENILRWYGHAGRSYFIQSSDQNNPLGKWKWAPLIEAGNNAPITHEVGNIGDKAFFRLKYTDQVPGPGKTLDTADFDRDGISNLNEIVPPSPLLASDATDPLDADTDHDGLPDGWERENRINANDNGTGNPNNGHNGDADNDGLTNSQEFALGTNPNNQDSDSDGIPDAWEALNGLDPTTQTDPSAIGPINLGFDAQLVDSPDTSFRPGAPSDLFDQTSVPGWRAALGQHIEVWDEADGNPYLELQAHLGAHGVKQSFHILPGRQIVFILRYKGRYQLDGYDNAFTLKVEGASELLINGSPASATNGIRSQSFMEDDGWEEFPVWRSASIVIKAPSSQINPAEIKLSLVPKTTTRLTAAGEEEITYGGFVDLIPVEVEQQDYNSAQGIRFCRWLDSFTGNSLDPDCADKDRDRFRIRISSVLPNLTKIRITSSGLATAVIGGQWGSKYSDGDYDVTMTEENGAMVSKWMLLVSDGDDDVGYNGIGTDNGPNDQTLLANFNSPIEITLPEHQNTKVVFAAQKPLGDVEIQPYYLSPAGDVPPDMERFITNHLEKMKEIYRQIGVRVGHYGIVGKAVPQSWFDAKPASNEVANYLTPSESNLARAAVRGMAVAEKQIRIGFVNATVMQVDGNPLREPFPVRGFTVQNTDGIIVSLEPLDARTILGVTAHEAGHALGLDHPSSTWNRWLMKGDGMIWNQNTLDSKRAQSGDFEIIRNRQSFYVPYVTN